MEKFFVFGFLTCFCLALGFGFWAYKTHQVFPIVIKAKVLRVEWDENSKRWRYYFQANHNGTRIMKDECLYKEKVFKTHQKINVHMNGNGTRCMSNMSIVPMAVAFASGLISVVLLLAYYGETRNQEKQAETENSIYQEPGRYVKTDGDTLFVGDNLGVIELHDEAGEGISTGDYGAVFFQGTPHKDDGDTFAGIHPFTANVYEDGTVSDISDTVIAQIEKAGFVIDRTETVYVAPEIEEPTENITPESTIPFVEATD